MSEDPCPDCGLTPSERQTPSLLPEQVLINPPKVPGTVEDSHAELAAEMRASAAHWGGALPRVDANGIEWATRVEQLGLAWAKERAERGQATE